MTDEPTVAPAEEFIGVVYTSPGGTTYTMRYNPDEEIPDEVTVDENGAPVAATRAVPG